MDNFISLLNLLWDNRASVRRKREKQSIRAVLSQKRRILSREAVKQCSADVVNTLATAPIFQQAQHIMIYYPIQKEIDLRKLHRLYPEKHFYMPVTHRRSLELREYTGEDNIKNGKFGIPEPQGKSYNGKIDVILIPAVAFDKQNNRLGRGGGYYDRFLRRYRRAHKIGIGYWFQLVDSVPVSLWDKRMDEVMVSKEFKPEQ